MNYDFCKIFGLLAFNLLIVGYIAKVFAFFMFVPIAQLVEHYSFVLQVPGSSPGKDIFFSPSFLHFFKKIRVSVSFSRDSMIYKPIGIFLQLIGTILGGH